MKKSMIFAAVAAVVLSACAKVETTQFTEDEPIAFSVYVPQMTKAGAIGQTTTSSIQRAEGEGGGFGVFAYYTDNNNYTSGSYYANFMYNQKVLYSTDHWEYSPVKYWPNEYGTGANSDATDKLSFLAYAPYVSSASGTSGITAMVANTAADGKKDAYVTYTVSTNPAEAVDLVWAVNDATGLPWLDLTKQTVTGTVPFKFKHALARLNVNVRGMFDEVRTTDGQVSSDNIDEHSKITIGKVEIKGNFIPSANLNLNNTDANTPRWGNYADAAEKTLTIANSDIATSLKATSDTNPETAFPSVTGVTKTNVNIYTGAAPAATDSKFFTIIPKTADAAQEFEVKITYFVTTEDGNLEGGVSSVKNVIYKNISFPAPGFVAQKNYSINIILGMTTVKVEATVDDNWTNGSNLEIDLPVNTTA